MSKEEERLLIKNRFREFLSKCVKPSRGKGDEKLSFGDGAVQSYITYLEKVFDYNPQKWMHIESIYDLRDVDTVKDVVEKILNDNNFKERDLNDSQYYRSNALKYYYCFVNALDMFKSSPDFESKGGDSLDSRQIIFFGAPGTGKSHKINGIASGDDKVTFRTTFHPDYDYAQFVGSYKPKKDGSSITYSFVPQVFANAVKKALEKNSQPIYLVIEEINRGNCAQIFGDIFQLLDRDENGVSRYSIDLDSDFAEWLGQKTLRLPRNFNILATMNTSDQSLFPMDSAFKRRFDWEYVPIDYKKTEADFTIVIGDKKYRWLDFLKKVNADIYTATESEDKQMGEFFVKPSDGKTIDLPTFCSKVLFYLWDSVYKDDDQNKKIFRFDWKFDDEEKNRPVTFQSLFEDEKTKIAIVQKMMEKLNVPEKQ